MTTEHYRERALEIKRTPTKTYAVSLAFTGGCHGVGNADRDTWTFLGPRRARIAYVAAIVVAFVLRRGLGLWVYAELDELEE